MAAKGPFPKTPYGWFNKVVRGMPYTDRTAKLLDFSVKPDSSLVDNMNRGASKQLPPELGMRRNTTRRKTLKELLEEKD